MNKYLIKALKEGRARKGLKQSDVATLLGVKGGTLSNYENGISEPDIDTFAMLCEIYNLDFAYVLSEAYGLGVQGEDFKIKPSEIENVKKYRSLDVSGQKHVDSVLDWETARMDELRQKDSRIGELEAENAERVVPTRLISYYFRNASAGTGQLIIDNLPEKDIEIPDIPKYKSVSYAISVNGSSMNPTYQDGDILLVEATQEIEVGEIGIFQVDGECFVKKLGNTELISLNRSCANVPLNESARPMGRVIGKL